jgi:ubiquinone/menaquinone biosynthesis C-methylase UbiE
LGDDLESKVNPQLTVADWDRRFRVQCRWSREIRKYCQTKYPVSPFSKVLEIGCGTGAVLSELDPIPGGVVVGVDLLFDRLKFFNNKIKSASLLAGDALDLPFCSGSFEQVFCHYFLLWIKEPKFALLEIKRVLADHGIFFIFSEPDYGGCIDYPTELSRLKEMQIDSLISQGADPFLGRRITYLLQDAGFRSIETGLIPWASRRNQLDDEFNSEWEMIEQDNAGRLSLDELRDLKSLDRSSRENHIRVEYIPVFYGWGTA